MPDKALWRIPKPAAPPSGPEAAESGPARESDWYPLVADALMNQTACTRAVSCGERLNGPQWTNPDVVGWIDPDPVAKVHNFPAQLVAVEVKRQSDQKSLLTGFAEACAYLDFAHFSWLVAPWCEGPAIERVGRLCVVHGLGLAYAHEEEDGDEMLWLEVGVPPRRHEPGAREFAEFLNRLKEAGIG